MVVSSDMPGGRLDDLPTRRVAGALDLGESRRVALVC
jgi:hypothetical protein